MNDGPAQDNGIPRGALIVVAIGLLACVVAAVASTDKSSGSSAEVLWAQEKELPDSRPAQVADGAQMRLTDVGLRATGVNVSGYSLFRSAATLRIDAGAPVGSARIGCEIAAPKGTEVAQTPGSRASYPRSSEDLFHQEIPEVVLAEFSSQGAALGVLEFGDLFEDGFSSERGVKVEWPDYEVGTERWEWFMPSGAPKQELVLPFASVWKTTAIPAAKYECTVTTSGGEATVRTGGALAKRGEPIDEDEEEEEG